MNVIKYVCLFPSLLVLMVGYGIFVAGRPKVALLFWFFGDFRCGALLFMMVHSIYKYKNR